MEELQCCDRFCFPCSKSLAGEVKQLLWKGRAVRTRGGLPRITTLWRRSSINNGIMRKYLMTSQCCLWHLVLRYQALSFQEWHRQLWEQILWWYVMEVGGCGPRLYNHHYWVAQRANGLRSEETTSTHLNLSRTALIRIYLPKPCTY